MGKAKIAPKWNVVGSFTSGKVNVELRYGIEAVVAMEMKHEDEGWKGRWDTDDLSNDIVNFCSEHNLVCDGECDVVELVSDVLHKMIELHDLLGGVE